MHVVLKLATFYAENVNNINNITVTYGVALRLSTTRKFVLKHRT